MQRILIDELILDNTNAPQLITLPTIATNRKPYRFANADTNGPEN